jgi:hypothetical protein
MMIIKQIYFNFTILVINYHNKINNKTNQLHLLVSRCIKNIVTMLTKVLQNQWINNENHHKIINQN